MSAARYLVIGAAGLVGSHLVSALRGRDVVATHHRRSTSASVPLDLRDASAVRAVIRAARPDVVLLAAAEPHVERCEQDPKNTWALNVEGTRTVVEAVTAASASLVVFSSEYVFDGSSGPYSENDAVGPLNEYGRQKVTVEELTEIVPRHLVCRTSGVFGRQRGGKNFVLRLVDAISRGHTFDVPSDQVITPTFAPSLAGAVVALLDAEVFGTFHVVGPEVLSRVDFARRVVAAFGLDPALLRPRPTADLGLSAMRPQSAGMSDAKLQGSLGHPLASAEHGLREIAAQMD